MLKKERKRTMETESRTQHQNGPLSFSNLPLEAQKTYVKDAYKPDEDELKFQKSRIKGTVNKQN